MLNKFKNILKNYQSLKQEIQEIRNNDIENLFSLWDKAQNTLESQDINVHFVDLKECYKLLDELIDDKLVVKSKSNIMKEIKLNEYLQNKNIEVIETDFGDFLANLLKYEGKHPILPLQGISFDEIQKKLKEKGIIVNNEKELKNYIVKEVKEKILLSTIGLTGANFISSDGKIFLIENEGNISLVSRLPKKHIIVTSLEKITQNYLTAAKLSLAQTIFSTASTYTSYINVISSVSRTKDVPGKTIKGLYGPKEIHLIVVDNGRKKLYDSEFKECLKCINCGLCSLVCPVHNNFLTQGFEQPGIKGIFLQLYQKPLKEVFKKVYCCSVCQLCEYVCPAGIKWGELIRKLRLLCINNNYEIERLKSAKENIQKYGNPIGETHEKGNEFYCC